MVTFSSLLYFSIHLTMKKLIALIPFLFYLILSGCATVTSAGITKGDERNLARSIHDVSAERVIRARMARAEGYKLKGIDVDVNEGVVLLVGNVQRQEDRIEAERIAWSAPRVEQVGNEVLIKDKQGMVRNAKDSLLTTLVKTRLTADRYVKGRNINVESHDGIVYLLGVARDQAELERVAEIASRTRGARQVISYVKIAGTDLPKRQFNTDIKQDDTEPAPLRELPSFLKESPTEPEAPDLEEPPSSKLSVEQDSIASMEIEDSLLGFNDKKLPHNIGGPASSVVPDVPYYVDPRSGKEIPVNFSDKDPEPVIIK